MELISSQRLPVDQATAWEALNDADILKAAIPGCESVEKISDSEYTVAMTAAVGPVKAKFKGRLTLSDVVAPKSYTIQFDGQGGPAGFGKGSAQVELVPDGEETELKYSVKAQVGGRMAQVGQRLIDGAARKMADDFFIAFGAELARRHGKPVPVAAARPARSSMTRIIAIFAMAALLAIIYFAFRKG
jgi:carbon monoxide dehydrogenase subunit G